MVGSVVPPRRARVAVLVGLLLVLGACSSSDAESVTPLTGTTAVATSSTSTTTPSSVPTITASTSTSSTAASTTTTASTTPEELRTDIEADLNEGRTAVIAALRDPQSPASESLANYFRFGALAGTVALIQGLAERGEAVRPGPASVERIDVESVTPVGTSAAVVVYCLSSDSVVYEIDSEVIVDDSAGSFRSTANLTVVDGRWVVDERETLVRFGEFRCAS